VGPGGQGVGPGEQGVGPGGQEVGLGNKGWASAAAVGQVGYDGVVGLEAWASRTGQPDEALERFRSAFSTSSAGRGAA
jgi:hydroxypyruvate isomerase